MMSSIHMEMRSPTGKPDRAPVDSAKGSKQGSEDYSGQMTVELCIVFPVVIVIAAIMFNALIFFSDCAEFDRVARNSVRIYSSSIGASEDSASVSASIRDAISQRMVNGEVEMSQSGSIDSGGYTTYRITYRYDPTLFGLPLRGSVFGVSMPKIEHSIAMCVDPYSPGKWLWSLKS